MRYLLLIAGLSLALNAFAEPTRLLTQPALSANKLAFVYAGDIWVANRDGSEPRRLTSHPAGEELPHFSPDGSRIAFVARYEDNADVYVIDVDGGQPRRLTWHPADDIATGWTADGESVTFVSRRETDHGRSGQWYHVSLAGGLPEKQMEARVFRGVYDAADERLAYIPFGSGYNGLFGGTSGWKGYRGGATPAIQVLNLEDQTVMTVPGEGANNFNPLWVNGDLYFLSDRGDKVANVYRYAADTAAVTRVSNEDTWEVRSADADATTLVYESGGRLMALDLPTGATREIEITIQPDLPQLRRQWKNASSVLQSAALSPTGKRAILTARGDVFTVPVDEGSTRNLTATDGRREYTALWSPSGDKIAYVEDSISGQQLVVMDQTGEGDVTRHTLGTHFYELEQWSAGDPARIAFTDNHLGLHLIDPDSGEIQTVAGGARRDDIEVSFSPDGRWLAYTLERENYLRDLMLWSVVGEESIRVTAGAADVAAPAFSRDGRYLFFAASTNSGPLQVGLNMTSRERPYRAGLYAVVLAATGESPLLPARGDETSDDTPDEEEESDEPATTVIDRDGLAGRIVALPVAERNYANLRATAGGKLLYIDAIQPGASNNPPGESARAANRLMRFDFEEREATAIAEGTQSFEVSADGEHLLMVNADDALAVAALADTIEPEALDIGGVRMLVDPRAEWRQIFDEAWRMEKEFFYDPDMHGLDWQAIYDQYRPLVEHVGRREDLGALIVQMIAEMQVGHNRTAGGDRHREAETNTGLLGANLRVEDGRYRLQRIYTGESWNPFLRAPLATPGNEAREGEYLLAVNGRELGASDNLFEWLQGTAGEQVTLRVAPAANGRNAREIVVEPISSERELRLWRWVEDNRRRVAEATGNRVGYVYLPNTAAAGFTFFNRMFFAQLDKDAMIIDERSNGGGQAANYITDVLSRQHLSGWKDRDGLTFDTPAGAMHGPKVMLIDQDAGSGGDFLPYSFRRLGIGKLIGTRTWGGLIGIAANPDLIDGGGLVVPFFRFFDADGEWGIENEGVAPDIEVPLDPVATNRGVDSQLEFAIRDVLSELGSFESEVPDSAPAYPDRLGE